MLGPTFAANAQDLTANVRNPYRNGRSDAPLILRVDLTYTGKALLQGKLELELRNLNRIATVTTSPIALTGGDKAVDVTLPGITVFDRSTPLEVHLNFLVGDQSPIQLGKFDVNVPSTQMRSQVIAVCDPWVNTSGRQLPGLVQSLLLESFQPKVANKRREFDVTINTFPASLTPTQMPRQALGYLPYDMVVLMADGFAQLEGSQLDALADWIRAGGSACIMVDKDLEEKHLEFLNAVVAIDGGRFEWTPQRQVTYAPASALGEANLITARAEFGRVAVLLDTLDTLDIEDRDAWLATKAWRDARLFLWRVKDSQRKHIGEIGKWFAERPKVSSADEPLINRRSNVRDREDLPEEDYSYVDEAYYFDDTDSTPSELVATMMPQSVRLIPFGLIIAVLGLFTLMIGPGDYMLLGRLKKRKLTWLLFPTLAILFTWVTLAMADHYMGQNTTTGEIVVRDVDRDGYLLRETRFVLHFPHENKTHDQTYRNAWHQAVGIDSARPWTVEEYDGGNDTPPVIEGRLPVHYTVRQQQNKWDPMLSRITTIHRKDDDAEPALPLNWRALEAWTWNRPTTTDRKINGQTLSTLRKILADGKPFAGEIAVLSAKTDLAESAISKHFERNDGYELYTDNRYLESETSFGNSMLPSFIIRMCRADPHHLFAVVNQVSPAGGQSIRDLCVLDPGRSEEWILLVLREEAGNTVIYRKLYSPQR